MSHSVSRHLRLEIDAYDDAIRRFIPGYEAMLDAAVDAVLEVATLARAVDLGSGTGALAERLLERHPTVEVELWDVDAAMLAKARERLSSFAPRAHFLERSFFESPVSTEAVMASLALHHVKELGEKRALYGQIARALPPGGVFVNADATMPEDEAERAAIYGGWKDHMVANGIAEQEAFQHFEAWSEEDRYFPLATETRAMADAGLEVEMRFRAPPSTVLVGKKLARL